MLNRLTVSTLLKSVITALAGCIVIILAIGAWNSFTRLQAANRVAVIANASSHVFKAMHNLRADRVATVRSLNADAIPTADYLAYFRSLRDAELPAMRKALGFLDRADFASKDQLLPQFKTLADELTTLQADSWAAVSKPKAERPAGLAKAYAANNDKLLPVLDGIASALVTTVSHQDAEIDQLLMIKQMAWLMRNIAGDATTIVSTGLASGKMPPDAARTYAQQVGGIEMAWTALDAATAGAKLSPAVTQALDLTKTTYFDPKYTGLRDRLFQAVAAGTPPEMTPVPGARSRSSIWARPCPSPSARSIRPPTVPTTRSLSRSAL